MKRTVIRRALEAGLVSLGVFIIVVCSAIPARAQALIRVSFRTQPSPEARLSP